MLNVLDLVGITVLLSSSFLEFEKKGLVRSIDMTRREIRVIIPDRSISKGQINALIKGHDDCPEEFYFMSIDRVRFAIYCSIVV